MNVPVSFLSHHIPSNTLQRISKITVKYVRFFRFPLTFCPQKKQKLLPRFHASKYIENALAARALPRMPRRWGSLKRSPRPPSWISGPICDKNGKGRRKAGDREVNGGTGGKGQGLDYLPQLGAMDPPLYTTREDSLVRCVSVSLLL